MIKRLNGTELSSSKQRAGLSSLSELLPRLIRSYELQAELVRRRQQIAAGVVASPSSEGPATQGTFAWYE